MKITVEVPESVLEDAAKAAWKQCFFRDGYGTSHGPGYDVVIAEVRKHIASPDFIREIANDVAFLVGHVKDDIVRDAVTEELRKMAKRVVKQEIQNGTLFKDNQPT